MKKKKCSKCGTEKSLDNFTKWSRSKDGLFTWCKKCKQEYNDKKYIDTQEFKNWKVRIMRRYQELMGCEECGFKGHHSQYQYDHIIPRTHGGGNLVSKLIGTNTTSWNSILKELKKCRVVCCNCHALSTHKEGLQNMAKGVTASNRGEHD